MPIPPVRLLAANDVPIRDSGDYVLYWMIAQRRTRFNFALQHAVDRCKRLGKPLLVVEPLQAGYRWAADRIHRFVIEGMRDNAAAIEKSPVHYFPYVEPQPGRAMPLLQALAGRACTVITDEFPCFFLPRVIAVMRRRIPAHLELVDSCGVMPLRRADRTFTVAHSYRRWMQKNILDVLLEMPKPNPLAGVKLPPLPSLPDAVNRRWKPANLEQLLETGGLSDIPIDHEVLPTLSAGGPREAGRKWKTFLHDSLDNYDEQRNHPSRPSTSGLSPFLHFGHISAHQMAADLLDHEDWTPDKASSPHGKNRGFWNVSSSAEAFLDQLLTWREVGFNLTHRHPDSYDKYDSLPHWALQTLDQHSGDRRPHLYTLEQFERAETHDPLWNAAQRELVTTGVMHNYLRMLWGKKILHWTPSPQQALAVMIQLNNKYALDGRDPNSYSGIFWVLGRYDRAWGPKRPVFGSVRYMTSDSTRKKLKLGDYLTRFGPNA